VVDNTQRPGGKPMKLYAKFAVDHNNRLFEITGYQLKDGVIEVYTVDGETYITHIGNIIICTTEGGDNQ
jgi:hypothetical protein